MPTIPAPADLLGDLTAAISAAGFAVVGPDSLDALRAFARRAARAGHWWAPAEADALGPHDLATPEAWEACRERLHAAAHEYSDWGGAEAPVWGAPLMHTSAGGREVWGVAVDGDGIVCLVELRTRRVGDDVVVVAAAIRPWGHVHAGTLAVWVPRAFGLRYSSGAGGQPVQVEHADISDVDEVGRPMLVTVGTGRPTCASAPFATTLAYDRHLDSHLVNRRDVCRIEAALTPHITADDLALAQAAAEAAEAEQERQAAESAAWQAEWAARVSAIAAEADDV